MSEPHTPKKTVILSGFHDYRTARRGSIQSIADALVRLGCDVSFISLRFSILSLAKGDSRNFLWRRANRPELVNGIQCYLWRTLIHPFHSRFALINSIVSPLYSLYARFPNQFFDDAVRAASYIIIESGLGIMFARRIKALNGAAIIIYRASDRINTIGAGSRLEMELEACGPIIDHFCLLAEKMAPDFTWARGKVFAVPLGVHPPDFSEIGANPYSAKLNAVSVGSMLFDPDFFACAARKFPDIQFHVIGCGVDFEVPANVHIYPEMNFKDTLPFVKYATFGIAPYRASSGAEYLSQSSLKLMQYEYLGIPAVCPQYAVGESSNRIGYQPGDADSIESAIKTVIRRSSHVGIRHFLTWDEIALRLLDPRRFPDTQISMFVESSSSHTAAAKHVSATLATPTISLILCTIGRSRELERLLTSLLDQTFQDFEIILVDQNPDGYLDSIIKKFAAKLSMSRVKSEKGLSKARNVGLRLARGDIVCFPDDDCWYRQTTLENAVNFLAENRNFDLLLGRTIDSDERESLSQFRSTSGPISKWIVWSSGNSNTLFVRREVARQIGGFDESLGVGATTPFQSGEESDFVLKALEEGKQAVFNRDHVVHHDQVDAKIGELQIRRAWNYSPGFGRVLRKHQFGFFYLLYRTVRTLARCAFSLAMLDGPQAKYKFVWALGTISGYFHSEGEK
jgi:2-beta-glucuronyltransferase